MYTPKIEETEVANVLYILRKKQKAVFPVKRSNLTPCHCTVSRIVLTRWDGLINVSSTLKDGVYIALYMNFQSKATLRSIKSFTGENNLFFVLMISQ